MKGIDVSENNETVDWQAVKDAGMEFAIIRCTYGKNGVDDNFADNIAGAKAVGLKVGAFHYSYALTVEDAAVEAAHCEKVITDSGVGLDLPVFFDMEDADNYKAKHGFSFEPELITAICKTFLGNMTLDCGVYASEDWLTNKIDWQSFGCPVWNAQWGNTDDISGFMWQYTNSLNIDGKNFDGDILYDA